MKAELFVVLGMHRSGTSSVARALKVFGISLGDELIPGAEDNQKGFWEDKEFVALNDEALAMVGSSWDTTSPLFEEQFDALLASDLLEAAVQLVKNKFISLNVDKFAVKDPRFCILLPFWKVVFEQLDIQVKYIVVGRQYQSILASILKRNAFSPSKTVLLWQSYLDALVKNLNSSDEYHYMRYETLLEQPEEQLQALAKFLDIECDSEELADYVSKFLDRSLNHSPSESMSITQLDRIESQFDAIMRSGKVGASCHAKLELLEDLFHQYDHYHQDSLDKMDNNVLKLSQENEFHKSIILSEQARIADLELQRDELSQVIDLVKSQYQAQEAEQEAIIAGYQAQLNELYMSFSWRVTGPLRLLSMLIKGDKAQLRVRYNQILESGGRLGKLARLGCMTKHAALLAMRQPHLIVKGMKNVRQNGLRAAWARVQSKTEEQQYVTLSAKVMPDSFEHMVILTTPHCEYLAKLIVQSLKQVDITSEVIFDKPLEGYSKDLHIVICPQMFESLPQSYVAYQMEQSVSSRWFNQTYFGKLNNAIAVFDYSQQNIAFLQEQGFNYRDLFYLPVGKLKVIDEIHHSDEYDVLFYGDINNDRRKEYIEALQKKFSVKIISNLFGEPLLDEMKKAKVVVNIHYYEGALLETTRLYECISANTLVVSEEGCNMQENAELRDVIDFVAVNDIKAMVSKVESLVKSRDLRETKRRDMQKWLTQTPNMFDFYFHRFLLAHDIISFDRFYDVAGDLINFQGDKVCLGLPESTERQRSFNVDNRFGFELFPGLRHKLGWVGCGMSYKFMLKKAKELGLERVTICEDDVLFHDDFPVRYEVITRYLNTLEDKDWDMFAGLIADFNPNTRVVKVENFESEELVYVDKMTSMVLNVYSPKVYDKILYWDETYLDVEKNTIDRYIESMEDCTVITTTSFIAGHKEEQDSTLWGFNNATYLEMINSSMQKVKAKRDEWVASQL